MPTLRALALALACLASRTCCGDPVFTNYGPFSVQSTGAGQLSSEAYRTSVTTAGILQVKYLAPPRHCSSVRIHFLGDGKEEALSAEIPPGASSGYTDLGPVTGGVHEVAPAG